MTKGIFWGLVALNIIWLTIWQTGIVADSMPNKEPKQINAEKIEIISPEPQIIEEPIITTAETTPTEAVTKETKSIEEVKTPPQNNIDTTTLSEANTADLNTEKKEEPPIETKEAPPTPQVEEKLACMEWSYFNKETVLDSIKALSRYKLDQNTTQQFVKGDSTYWVYIPPATNEQILGENIVLLKKLGIKDYFVIHDGAEWNNAISLGVFKTEEGAKRQLARLKSLKLESAKWAERSNTPKIILQISQLSEKNVKQVIDVKKKFSNTRLKRKSCE